MKNEIFYFFEDIKENKIYFYNIQSKKVILINRETNNKNINSVLIASSSYLLSILGKYFLIDIGFNIWKILLSITLMSMIIGYVCENIWFNKKIEKDMLNKKEVVLLENEDIKNKILIRTKEQKKWLINCLLCLILMLVITYTFFSNNIVMLMGLGLNGFIFGMLVYSTLSYKNNVKNIFKIIN